MAEKLTINQWAEEDRPREKMMLHGVGTLSDAELLAILIGSGNTEDSAVELMRKVLSDYHNSLNELGKTTVDELYKSTDCYLPVEKREVSALKTLAGNRFVTVCR